MTLTRGLRRCAISLATIVAAMALPAQTAMATSPSEGSGAFAFTPGSLSATTRMADGNVIIEGRGAGTFTGTLSGPFTQTLHQVIHPNGTSTFQGTATCTCTIQGRTGTVVLRFEGSGGATPTMPFDGRFVTQHGTLGLSDLRATGTFHGVGAGAVPSGTYTIRYHFD